MRGEGLTHIVEGAMYVEIHEGDVLYVPRHVSMCVSVYVCMYICTYSGRGYVCRNT